MVPDGFKFYRHIGLIPADWEVLSANDVCLKITDGTHDTPVPIKSGIPYIKSVHIKRGRVEFEKCLFLDKRDHDVIYRRCNPQKGDLLIVNIGAGNIGDYAYVDVEFEFSMKNVALLKPNPCLINSQYLFQYYQSVKYKVVRSTKTGGAQPFLSLRDLKRLKIITPSISEQKKIAKILSTGDQAIKVTEKLISNSQQQKKSLMQQLLTGKKRLTGFSDEWRDSTLINLVDISTGKSKSKFINETGERYIIDMGSISRDGKLIPSKKTSLDEDYLIQGQLVMPKDDIGGGNIIGRVGYIDKNQNYILGDHVYVLSVHGCDSLFLSYLINYDTVNKSLRRKANGTAQLGLGKKDVEKQPVYIPQTIEEQQKITSVLTASDREIEALQQKLEYLKQEKKALMQQLLTGKRRVKIDEMDSQGEVA